MCSLLLFAGHETSANQISISVIYLLDNPKQLAEIRQDPALLRPALEELLRFASLKQHDLIRVVAEDMDFAGVRMLKGDGVITSQPSANHDPSVFPDPDRFDIHRKTTGHLAFGHGAHACLGASLARVEVEVALERILRRLPNLALAANVDEIPFRHDMLIYGVHALPISWSEA
jgi:cytochrome P450